MTAFLTGCVIGLVLGGALGALAVVLVQIAKHPEGYVSAGAIYCTCSRPAVATDERHRADCGRWL